MRVDISDQGRRSWRQEKDINIRIDGNVVQIDAEGDGGNILRSERLQVNSESKEKPNVPPGQKKQSMAAPSMRHQHR